MVEQNGAHSPGPSPEEQFEARMKQLFRETLAGALPDLESRIGQNVLATAEAAIAKRVQEAKAEVDAYKGQQLAPPAPAVEDSPKDLASTIRWAIAYLPKAFAEALDSYDKLTTIRMKQQNPAVMMAEWSKTNPDMLAFYAQRYAPEPLANIMAPLMAKAMADASTATARRFIRMGNTGGGRLADDPFGEPQDTLDLPSDSFEPTPAGKPQETASMQRRRRVTLREALR